MMELQSKLVFNIGRPYRISCVMHSCIPSTRKVRGIFRASYRGLLTWLKNIFELPGREVELKT